MNLAFREPLIHVHLTFNFVNYSNIKKKKKYLEFLTHQLKYTIMEIFSLEWYNIFIILINLDDEFSYRILCSPSTKFYTYTSKLVKENYRINRLKLFLKIVLKTVFNTFFLFTCSCLKPIVNLTVNFKTRSKDICRFNFPKTWIASWSRLYQRFIECLLISLMNIRIQINS